MTLLIGVQSISLLKKNIWSCLCHILHIDPAAALTRQVATFPLSLGGLGFRSATRTKQSAHRTSWADSLGMLHNRHSSVADAFLCLWLPLIRHGFRATLLACCLAWCAPSFSG